MSFFALFLYLTLYLQEVLNLSPLDAGLVYLPGTVVMFIVSGATAPLSGRISPGTLIVAGLFLVACGLALMLIVQVESTWVALLPGELVVCVGTGIVNPALATVAIASLPADQSGLAAGVNDAFRQVGVAVGVAGFGALVPAQAALGKGSPGAYVLGLHHAILIGTALAAVGAIVVAKLISSRSFALHHAAVAAGAEPVVGLH